MTEVIKIKMKCKISNNICGVDLCDRCPCVCDSCQLYFIENGKKILCEIEEINEKFLE